MSIPRPMLHWLGWLPGQAVIIEMTEDKSVIVRLPQQSDFGPVVGPRIIYGGHDGVKT